VQLDETPQLPLTNGPSLAAVQIDDEIAILLGQIEVIAMTHGDHGRYAQTVVAGKQLRVGVYLSESFWRSLSLGV